uniref:Uncharacterized protein n=1 Tax=Anas platyrhynchos TaxID=8839 RepID=A0A8B9ZGI5_ANAPL
MAAGACLNQRRAASRRAPLPPLPPLGSIPPSRNGGGRDVSGGRSGVALAPGSGGRARWRTPVVPAAREAEPAGSLEPRSSGLQCAIGIAPVNSHCSVAWATQRDAGSFCCPPLALF